MSFLDSVIGALCGGSTLEASGGGLLQHLGEMLSTDQQGGGMTGRLQAFEQAWLSGVIGSWIGTGQNLPILPEQLNQVLGSGRIAAMARSLGLSPGQITAQLAQLLPELINHLTPNGQVPAIGIAHEDVAGALTAVLARLTASRYGTFRRPRPALVLNVSHHTPFS